jgi:hypothetical protein
MTAANYYRATGGEHMKGPYRASTAFARETAIFFRSHRVECGWHLDGIYENTATRPELSGSSPREGAERSYLVGGGRLRHVRGEGVVTKRDESPSSIYFRRG